MNIIQKVSIDIVWWNCIPSNWHLHASFAHFRTYCSQGPHCPDSNSFCPLSSSGQDGSRSCCQSVHCPCTLSTFCIQSPFNEASRSQPTVVTKCSCASFQISQIQLQSLGHIVPTLAEVPLFVQEIGVWYRKTKYQILLLLWKNKGLRFFQFN